jgi:hypothetical protein
MRHQVRPDRCNSHPSQVISGSGVQYATPDSLRVFFDTRAQLAEGHVKHPRIAFLIDEGQRPRSSPSSAINQEGLALAHDSRNPGVCVHGRNGASQPTPGNYAHDVLARDRITQRALCQS